VYGPIMPDFVNSCHSCDGFLYKDIPLPLIQYLTTQHLVILLPHQRPTT